MEARTYPDLTLKKDGMQFVCIYDQQQSEIQFRLKGKNTQRRWYSKSHDERKQILDAVGQDAMRRWNYGA